MPTCCICFQSYVSVNGLNHHLNIYHASKLRSVLKCVEDKCLRLCRSWQQLRRHFIRDHKFPVHAYPTSKVLPTNEIAESVSVGAANLASQDGSCDCDSYEDTVSVDDSREVPKSDVLRNVVLADATSFMCKLYANPSLPRNHVQTVLGDVKLLLQNAVSNLVPSLAEILHCDDSAEKKEHEMKKVVESMLEPFELTLSTEHRRFNFLRESGYFVDAEDYIVGDRMDEKYRAGHIVLERVSVSGKYMPIEKTLSRFLSIPGVLDKIKEYHLFLKAEEENGVVSNFIQAKLWKRKSRSFGEKFVLPLFIYFDDFEVSNPLGSHAGIYKIGAVYFSLPTLPPEYQSSVENVFLSLLFHSSDRAVPQDGNSYVFRKFIEDLNMLQTDGVSVQVDGRCAERIFFCVGLLLADNKGFHDVMGFAGGFNANFYCRFCKGHKNDLKLQTVGSNSSLRKVSEYREDMELGMKLSGVSQDSVWNSLLNFHVYENYSVDMLHDLLEGVCKTDMVIILQYFICEKESFSIASLNARINTFNYTLNGLKNKPPCLTFEDVQAGHLSMSATEMLHFTLLFAYYVGDLIEPDMYKSAHWRLYITLREILDIATAKSFQKECIPHFQFLVEKHHKIRIQELGVLKKPKDHFLEHYELAMDMSGPASHLSTAKFESKHRVLKTNAKNTMSRVNITHTLFVKEELAFANRLACKKGLEKVLETGQLEHYSCPSFIDNYVLFRSSLPDSFGGTCTTTTWATVNGITYRKGSVLCIDLELDSFPDFASIETILLNDNSEICFVCKLFSTLTYNENLHAYAVAETSVLKCVCVKELVNPFIVLYHILSSGDGYVTTRQML